MLVLSRRPEESLVVGEDITLTVLAIDGDRVKLGIVAPRHVPVLRGEIYRQLQQANATAATSAAHTTVGVANALRGPRKSTGNG
jgi:carbon storage regulator